jgi:AhpD family alkylhydroperoxidase
MTSHTDTDTRPAADDVLVRVPPRLDVDALVPAFSAAVEALDAAATAELDRAGTDPALRELLRLRASQLNGCAYCVDTHARDARRAGLRPQQVDAVAVWRESSFFTAAQRDALELTEAVTLLARTRVPEPVVAAAVARFGEQGTAALLALLVTINAWNTIGVTARCWTPAVTPV